MVFEGATSSEGGSNEHHPCLPDWRAPCLALLSLFDPPPSKKTHNKFIKGPSPMLLEIQTNCQTGKLLLKSKSCQVFKNNNHLFATVGSNHGFSRFPTIGGLLEK